MASLGWALGGSRRLGVAERLAALAGRIVGRSGRIGWVRAPGLAGAWFRGRDLRAPARESFRRWWRRTGGGERDSGEHEP